MISSGPKKRFLNTTLGQSKDKSAAEEVEVRRVNVEVESRNFSSAVSKGGRMIGRECYRCLTTVCQKWHSYGKLNLPLCNACVVILDVAVCGYCGQLECGDDDRVRFNCSTCARATHELCEQEWRTPGPNPHDMCIVCELSARIRARDYKTGSLRLVPRDLPSLLNHHIFFFSRYFEGPGPSRRKIPPLDSARSLQGQSKLDQNSSAHSPSRSPHSPSRSRQSPTLSQAGANNYPSLRSKSRNAGGTGPPSFDKILQLTSKPEVYVQESSEISNIIATFARKWDSLSRETLFLPDVNKTAQPILDPRMKGLGGAKSFRTFPATPNDALEALGPRLRTLALCYLTRPFPTEPVRDSSSKSLAASHGPSNYRRLDAADCLFYFAHDFGICPELLSKSQTRELIFQTLGQNPMFGIMGIIAQKGHGGAESTSATATLGSQDRLQAQNLHLEDMMSDFFVRVVKQQVRKSHWNADMRISSKAGSKKEEVQLTSLDLYEYLELTRLNDEQFMQSVIKKYPTAEELEQIWIEEQAYHARMLEYENIVAGTKIPYPLDAEVQNSAVLEVWLRSLVDCFNFLAAPGDVGQLFAVSGSPVTSAAVQAHSVPRGSRSRPSLAVPAAPASDEEAAASAVVEGKPGLTAVPLQRVYSADSEDRPGMVVTFKQLDVDKNNMISRRDLIQAMQSEWLADIFLATFEPTAEPHAISWTEWNARGSDPVGLAWEALLSENLTVEERIDRGVMILQRHTAGTWLEPDGRERSHHVTPSGPDDAALAAGIGVLLLVNEEGKPIVSKVRRPGPSDERLYAGDVVVSVNGVSLEEMLPGAAVATILGMLGDDVKDGYFELGVLQKKVVSRQKIYRKVPPRRNVMSMTDMSVAREAKGTISDVDVLKMFRMFDVIPHLVNDEEIYILLDKVRPMQDLAPDDPFSMDYDDLQYVLTEMAKSAVIMNKTLPCPEDDDMLRTHKLHLSETAKLLETPEGSFSFTDLDACMLHLLNYMRLPRCDGPEGKSWAAHRYMQRLLAQRQAEVETLDNEGYKLPAQSRELDKSVWQVPEVLVRSDGVHDYMQMSRRLRVNSMRVVSQQLLDLKPRVVLSNLKIAPSQLKALGGAMKSNCHVYELCINSCGLGEEGMRALCEALKYNKHLHVLDLSHNPIGGQGLQKASGSIGVLTDLFEHSDELYELKLRSCQLSDKDVEALMEGTRGSKMLSRLDVSHNSVGDRGAGVLARAIVAREALVFVNMSWNTASHVGIEMVKKATHKRNKAQAKALEISNAFASLTNLNLASIASPATLTMVSTKDDSMMLNDTSMASMSSMASPVSPAYHDVSYDLSDLSDLSLPELVEHLHNVQRNEAHDRVATPSVIVITDACRAREKSPSRSPRILSAVGTPKAAKSFAVHSKRKDSKPPQSGMVSPLRSHTASAAEEPSVEAVAADNVMTQKEYLRMKTLLGKHGLDLGERLSMLRMHTEQVKISVIQAWEMLEPFNHSEYSFAASNYIMSLLRTAKERDALLMLREAVQAGERTIARSRDTSPDRAPGSIDQVEVHHVPHGGAALKSNTRYLEGSPNRSPINTPSPAPSARSPHPNVPPKVRHPRRTSVASQGSQDPDAGAHEDQQLASVGHGSKDNTRHGSFSSVYSSSHTSLLNSLMYDERVGGPINTFVGGAGVASKNQASKHPKGTRASGWLV